MSKLEYKINSLLNNSPKLKKVIKRTYQLGMYSISKKIKSEGNIKRISPNDGMEYFFGYYDKSPWDSKNRYMLCLRVKDTTKHVAPKEEAEIIIFDTENNNSYEILAKTRTWNIQQGCMLQWLGPDYSERIIYNDFREGKYCSVILNIKNKEEIIIDMPVYSVSNNGKFALTLDFSRLHRLRKGYGYSNIEEENKELKIPNSDCIWKVDLEKNKIIPILKYTDFYKFETREEMIGSEHKVNHIMLNPSSNRFMVLHRWSKNGKKFTRLVTSNIDGSEMYNLSDDDMISHCCWKNDNEILAYARKYKNGDGYYFMKDRSTEYKKLWENISGDGHPSYSPNRKYVITDTYPDRSRLSSLYLMNGENISKIARVFSPFKYDNDLRCDLHPRWSRDGSKICFDSTYEGSRQLYILKI